MMLRGRPKRLPAPGAGSTLRRAAVLAALSVCVLLAGCEDGQPPYSVVGGDDPTDFLPPGGIVPGTTSDFDSLYYYDTTRYEVVVPQPTTPLSLIKRGEILVPLGASVADRIRPDLADATLGRVYANEHLLGFEGATDPNQRDTFQAGPVIGDASLFYPLLTAAGASTWEYNHGPPENLWTRRDTLLGPDQAPDSQPPAAGTVWRLSARSTVRLDLRDTYIPNTFNMDYLISSVQGNGIFWHSYTIIAERVERLQGDGVPQPQDNPRSPWLARDALGLSDPNSPIPSAVDQCLDALWGTLDLHPVRVAGQLPGSPAGTMVGEIRVGDRISTWSYLAVDPEALAPRIGDPDAVPPRDPIPSCAGAGVEVAPQFPTGRFRLLLLYEAVVEDAYDQWVEIGGAAGVEADVGRYGQLNDGGEIDVVKVVVTLWLGAPVVQPTERIEIYLQRGIGPVIYRTGVRRETAQRTRLRQCRINGQPFDPSYFSYLD